MAYDRVLLFTCSIRATAQWCSCYVPLSLSLRFTLSVFQACIISSKCCSYCAYYLPLSSFLKDILTDAIDPTAYVYTICILCRTKQMKYRKKRAALQALDLNIRPTKRVRRLKTGPQDTPIAQLPALPTDLRPPHAPVTGPAEPPPALQPSPAPVMDRPAVPTGFLPVYKWQYIQGFHSAIEAVRMETC